MCYVNLRDEYGKKLDERIAVLRESGQPELAETLDLLKAYATEQSRSPVFVPQPYPVYTPSWPSSAWIATTTTTDHTTNVKTY